MLRKLLQYDLLRTEECESVSYNQIDENMG